MGCRQTTSVWTDGRYVGSDAGGGIERKKTLPRRDVPEDDFIRLVRAAARSQHGPAVGREADVGEPVFGFGAQRLRSLASIHVPEVHDVLFDVAAEGRRTLLQTREPSAIGRSKEVADRCIVRQSAQEFRSEEHTSELQS